MSTATARALPTPFEIVRDLAPLEERRDWATIATFLPAIPAELDRDWCCVADKVAFALGRVRRYADAIDLVVRAYAVLPAPRRASALVWLHYAGCMELLSPSRAQRPTKIPDRETLREGFRKWVAEALRADPDSIKDLYRLGIWEAQVESRRDKPALAAFERAIAAYRGFDEAFRERRHDLRGYYVRALYAAARSALRLGLVIRARHHIFACIREDRNRDHVASLFKMHLAGTVCVRHGEPDAAERAFRLALDADAVRDRTFVFSSLARLRLAQGDPTDAVAWIERNVRPERRPPDVWRTLGDAQGVLGDVRAAENAYRNALLRDRSGRHRTLVAVGALHQAKGDLDQAARDYEQAREFRRRRWLSDDIAALRGLISVRKAQGRADEAASLERELAPLERSHGHREERA